MQKPYRNICYRCGKERIVTKIWKERVGNSVVENTETVCPDKKCQEAMEQEIKKQKNKRLQMENRKRESSRNRKITVHNKTVRR